MKLFGRPLTRPDLVVILRSAVSVLIVTMARKFFVASARSNLKPAHKVLSIWLGLSRTAKTK